MNDLCNKFTSELSGLRDFENNINENEEKDGQDPLERKIFYLFSHENGDDKIKGFKKTQNKKSKASSASEGASQKSGTGSSKSNKVQIEFSFNDIVKLDSLELSGKIFTHDKRLA